MSLDKFKPLDTKFYNRIILKEPLTIFFKIFTNLASFKFFIIICFLFYFILPKTPALLYIFLMLIDALLIEIFKRLIKRERPNIKRLVKEKGYSYPSGHTTSATCFYGFTIFLTLASDIILPLKLIISLSLIFFIFLIGFSRIYLGVHYLSDIIGGLLIGSSYLLLYIYLTNNILNFL